MQKATLTKEQAKALEYAFENLGYTRTSKGNAQIVMAHVAYYNTITNKSTNWGGSVKSFNNLSLDTLIRALYIGYEIEKTPEEQLAEHYRKISTSNQEYNAGICNGIRKTLQILGITIEGVNTQNGTDDPASK